MTSDFHERLPPDVPACDLLLLAGDCLPASGRVGTHSKARPPFIWELEEWLERQRAGEVVGVAGNHDGIAKTHPDVVRALPWIYLENETVDVDGIKVFGSPMSMPFGGWEFMAPEDELLKVWESIPDDVDVVMVHGPAAGVLDKTRRGTHTGSRTLRDRIAELPNLRLLATGHIHEEYGTTAIPRRVANDEAWDGEGEGIDWITCVNGSYLDEQYRPGNPPIEVEL